LKTAEIDWAGSATHSTKIPPASVQFYAYKDLATVKKVAKSLHPHCLAMSAFGPPHLHPKVILKVY